MGVTYPPVFGHWSEPFASVQIWSAPPRNHDWVAACTTLG
jgi:hypothetical protein